MKKIQFLFLILFSVFTGMAQIETLPFLSTGVDQLPENYGGKEEFKRFLDYHLNYPESSLKNKTEGSIKIQYICDTSGRLASYKLLNNLDSAIDAEAIRLFRLLLWNPAIKENKPITYEHTISIPFSISKYKKSLKRRDKENPNPANLPIDKNYTIHEKANKQPNYIYGSDSLLKYIYSELEYPQEAKTKSIEGTVVLNFIVEPNGFLSNIEVLKPVGGGCQEEAIRVLGATKWLPAQKDNKLVRCKMTYSVVFKLSSEYRDNSQGSQRIGGY